MIAIKLVGALTRQRPPALHGRSSRLDRGGGSLYGPFVNVVKRGAAIVVGNAFGEDVVDSVSCGLERVVGGAVLEIV
jgi:hypothetical protein